MFHRNSGPRVHRSPGDLCSGIDVPLNVWIREAPGWLLCTPSNAATSDPNHPTSFPSTRPITAPVTIHHMSIHSRHWASRDEVCRQLRERQVSRYLLVITSSTLACRRDWWSSTCTKQHGEGFTVSQ